MRFIAILTDGDDLTLYKVNDELYQRIIAFLGSTNLQKLYDTCCPGACEDDDRRAEANKLYEELRKCFIVDGDLIQEY